MSDSSPFGAIGGNLALDFVNTIANRGDPDKRRDLLVRVADLQSWFTGVGLPAKGLGEGDLAAARAIRERLHDVFLLPTQRRAVDQSALAVFEQDFHAASRARRLLSKQKRVVWGWARDASALHKAIYPVLAEAVELLASKDLEKVRACQGPGCGWLFVDRSRNRPRRWCSMSDCGNKAKARRYHRRQADG